VDADTHTIAYWRDASGGEHSRGVAPPHLPMSLVGCKVYTVPAAHSGLAEVHIDYDDIDGAPPPHASSTTAAAARYRPCRHLAFRGLGVDRLLTALMAAGATMHMR